MTRDAWITLAIVAACATAGLAGAVGLALRTRLRRGPRATVRRDARRVLKQRAKRAGLRRHDFWSDHSRRVRRNANAILADPAQWVDFEQHASREGHS